MTRVVKVMTIREGAHVACKYFDKVEALRDYLRELTDVSPLLYGARMASRRSTSEMVK